MSPVHSLHVFEDVQESRGFRYWMAVAREFGDDPALPREQLAAAPHMAEHHGELGLHVAETAQSATSSLASPALAVKQNRGAYRLGPLLNLLASSDQLACARLSAHIPKIRRQSFATAEWE